MAKAKKEKVVASKDNGNENGDSISTVKLMPIQKKTVTFTIRGLSPLIQHQWSDKALSMMRDKHAGKKTKTRDVRDPQAEGRAAMYVNDAGKPGVPAMAIKTAIISAAHKDIGIEKTLVKKALFLVTDDSRKILQMDCDEPEIREDTVRVGQGAADLRYRPYFLRWSVRVTFEIDAELLQVNDLLNLVDRAGFGVGVGEWRPEKGGEFGRFEVDRSLPVESN